MVELAAADLVRHGRFGVGQVQQVNDKEVAVAFRDGKERVVECDEAVPLSSDGFWHLVYRHPDQVAQELEERPAKAVAFLLRDLPNNQAQTAEIRAQLEEFVPGDWRSWWQRTQRLLRQEPTVDTSRSPEGIYALAEKPRSYIEELYERFQALPRFGPRAEDVASGTINPEKLAVARSILVAAANGEELASDAQRQVRAFLERAIASGAVAVPHRVDLLLRLQGVEWMGEGEARLVWTELCRAPIRLYELDRFAQNRAVDALLEYVGAGDGRESLLTAFATGPALAAQVCEEYIARGQPEVIAQGILVGLAENIVSPDADKEEIRRWYPALAQRLQGLSATLHRLVFDASAQPDWDRLALHLGGLLVRLSGLDSREEVAEEVLQGFVGLWRRSLVFAPSGKKVLFLSIPLESRLRPHVFQPILAAIFADPHLEMADVFVEQMSQIQDSSPELYLRCIIDEHWVWPSEVEALCYLVDRLHSKAELMRWLAQRTIELAQADREALPRYLPLLDRLAAHGQDAAWQEKVNGLRQQAFQDLCSAVKEGTAPQIPTFAFDAIALAGLQDFVAEVELQLNATEARSRTQVEQAREESRLAQERLAQSEASLEELRRGFRQPDRATRFDERMRILRGFAAMASELERFVSLRDTGSRELVGVVRRLNSLLGSFGVIPFGGLGDRVAFDPSRHEFVGASTGPVGIVTTTARGYTILDDEGNERILKPARVVQVEGGP